MRLFILSALLLTSCEVETHKHYRVIRCSKHADQCLIGFSFETAEACVSFVKRASKVQPDVERFCVEASE